MTPRCPMMSSAACRRTDLLSAMFEYGIDLRERRVFLQCGIGEAEEAGKNIAELVIRGLLYLDKTKGSIQLWIHTPGGDVDDMFAIYDVMRTLENEVETIGHGTVQSAGALLLAAGTKGRRYATPHCSYMVHEFQDGVTKRGTTLQRIHLNEKIASKKQWADLMGKACEHKNGMDAAFWLKLIRTKPETYMHAKKMLAHGVIDEIWPREDDDE